MVLALVLVGGGLLFWALDYNRGFILIALGNHLVQISLWFAVLLLVTTWVIWRIVRRLVRPALRTWRGRQLRRGAQRQRAVLAAVADYYEGNWAGARTALVRSARYSTIPGLNYVLAADAAARLGEDAAATALLDSAAQEIPADSPALIVARARLALRRRDYQGAREILRAGLVRHPDHPQIHDLLRTVLEKCQDWAGLAELLPALRRSGASASDLPGMESRLHVGRLAALAQPVAEAQRPAQLAELERLWRRVPKPLRSQTDCLRARARALVALGDGQRAERELRRHLEREWDPELVLDWAHAPDPGQLRDRLAVAERWLREHGESWQLLLALGRLCRLLEVRGKSREYLERAAQLAPRPEVHVELGETLSASGDQPGAVRCFRRAARDCLPGI